MDDKSADVSNNIQRQLGVYFEIRRLSRTSQYEVINIESLYTEQALLIYKNHINMNYDWMKTQNHFYGELKKRYLELIHLIDKK
jgi:hypothetical protein